MTVYIPCYFNSIKEREENFYKNLNQFLNLGYKVVLYWMNDFKCSIENDNLTIINTKKTKIIEIRNVILNTFYSTDDDYCIFSDDDIFLKSEIKERFDCICFKNDYNKGLTETFKISASLMLLRNFRKAYNIIPFFDESLLAAEGIDFGMTLNELGIKTYRKSTDDIIVFKGQSSIFENPLKKVYELTQDYKYLYNKHAKRNKKNIRDTE